MSEDFKSELKKIKRLSDQLCTIHSWLRDKYQTLASYLDYFTMAISCGLIALAFAPSDILPNGTIMLPIISLVNFVLSIFQYMNGWKEKSQAHHRSCEVYADVKSECGRIATSGMALTSNDMQRIRSKYDMATRVGSHISEKHFVSGKKRHLLKVEVSQYLDRYPGACLTWIRIAIFFRDNLNINLLLDPNAPPNFSSNTGTNSKRSS